jgi:hypothetical protein
MWRIIGQVTNPVLSLHYLYIISTSSLHYLYMWRIIGQVTNSVRAPLHLKADVLAKLNYQGLDLTFRSIRVQISIRPLTTGKVTRELTRSLIYITHVA